LATLRVVEAPSNLARGYRFFHNAVGKICLLVPVVCDAIGAEASAHFQVKLMEQALHDGGNGEVKGMMAEPDEGSISTMAALAIREVARASLSAS